ncbi:MAG: hypothetical protein OXS47_12880 [Chloroflexota bacterium]|nr:hypothetical protein [Chloroflexota bacterium]
MTTEERISRLEGAYEQVDQRLGDLTQAVSSLREELRGEIGSLRQDMTGQLGDLRSEMNGRFNALLVIGAGAWVTTVGLIIGLYLQS